jgi:hypothetical protein
MVYFLQAKPNKRYYQVDESSFAKGGISRLQTPFLVKIPGKAFFVSDFSAHNAKKLQSTTV